MNHATFQEATSVNHVDDGDDDDDSADDDGTIVWPCFPNTILATSGKTK